jgi:hypothetical protein
MDCKSDVSDKKLQIQKNKQDYVLYTTYPIISSEITSAKKYSKARQTKEKLNGSLKVGKTNKKYSIFFFRVYFWVPQTGLALSTRK